MNGFGRAARQRLAEEQQLHALITAELRSRLVRLARSHGCTADQAEDAAQLACVQLWRKPEALKPENVGLLHSIARGEALKTLRTARRHDGTGNQRFVLLSALEPA